jgi:Transglutaminase-like superfamily
MRHPFRAPARLAAVPLLLLLLGAVPRPALAGDEEPVPAPRFDRVDHARPADHLALSGQVADAARFRQLATQLRGEDDRATLVAIHRWIDRNLDQDEGVAGRWRSPDQMLRDRTYGSCADHAELFGTLARAAGIPTIWVKTMDEAWIRDALEGRTAARDYRGHVFLEVHLDGAWRLLDATEGRLWMRYDPATRWLPGHRLAYDKGDDPYDLVLSCRWELWKRQTDAWVAALDPALLPWSGADDLLGGWRVYVAGNQPLYPVAVTACRKLGFIVERSFNTAWDRILPLAHGHVLVVLCDQGAPVLPEPWRAALLPTDWKDVVAQGGFAVRKLDDGTRVLLVAASDPMQVLSQVAQGLR